MPQDKAIAEVRKSYEDATAVSRDPYIGYIDNVIAADEAKHIIEVARNRIKRAKVSSEGKGVVSKGRTGGNCWLSHDTDPTIQSVAHRIAGIIGIPLENAEALQVVYYGPGQEYKSHYDAYDLSTLRGQRCCEQGGQRMVTSLVYLNDVPGGGETRFLNAGDDGQGVSVDAQRGRMAIFHNCKDGTTDVHKKSLHAGMPVAEGEKWAFNIWFHARPMNEKQDFSDYPKPPHTEYGLLTNIDQRINRAKNHFKTALADIRTELEGSPKHPEHTLPCLTYFDTYGGKYLEPACLPADSRPVLSLIDRPILDRLANKKSRAELLRDKRVEGVAPVTAFTVEEAAAYPDTPLWFVKVSLGTSGKDISVITRDDLQGYTLPRHMILQQAVSNLELIDGRKFTSRVYVLIWSGAVYLYHNGWNIIHAVPYDANSTDYSVQIDHTGYTHKDSPVKMMALQDYDRYPYFETAIHTMIRELYPVFEECISASSSTRFVLLGIDTLLQADGGVKLVEINIIPNFNHTADINRSVNIPFFRDATRVMMGLDHDNFTVINQE